MEAAVQRLYAEQDDVTGVVLTSAKKTFFAGGNLKSMVTATAGRRRGDLHDGRGRQGQPPPPRDLPPPGRRRHQRRRTRRRPRDRAGGQPSHRRRRPLGEDRPARGHARPAARRRRRHPRRTHARPAVGADGRAACPGTQFDPQGALAKGLVDELVADPRGARPGREGVDRSATSDDEDAAKNPWDRAGYRMPGGTPKTPALAQFLPAFPALLRKQTKGAVYPAPRAIMSAAVEGAQVDFDTASRIEIRYFTDLVVNQQAKNMIQAFFFDLQAINSGSLRPAGHRALEGHQGRRPRRRDDGRRHRLLVCPRRHAGRAQGRLDRERREGQGLHRQAQRQGRRARQAHAGEGRRAARPDHRRPPTRPTSPAATSSSRPSSRTRRSRPRSSPRSRRSSTTTRCCAPTPRRCRSPSWPTGVDRPADFIGLHFFSPVDKMPLVEIIRGEETSDVALAKAYDVVQQIRKTPIVVNDSRGFYTSRVIGTQINEGLSDARRGRPPGVARARGDVGRLPGRRRSRSATSSTWS